MGNPGENFAFAPAAGVRAKLERLGKRTVADETIDQCLSKANERHDVIELDQAIGGGMKVGGGVGGRVMSGGHGIPIVRVMLRIVA